jgi:hypothetical protein
MNPELKAYLDWENTDDFRKLSYAEQLQTRDTFFKEYAAKNNLLGGGYSEDQLSTFYNQLVMRPGKNQNPAFDDAQNQLMNNFVNPNIAALQGTIKNTAENDPEIAKMEERFRIDLGQMYPDLSPEEIELKVKDNMALYQEQGADSIIKNLSSLATLSGQYSGLGVMQKLQNMLPIDDTILTPLVGSGKNQDYIYSTDFKKTLDYIDQMVANEKSKGRTFYSADMSDYYSLSKTVNQVLMSVVTSPGMSALEEGSRSLILNSLGSMALNPVADKALVQFLPNVIRASAEAAGWTASDYMEKITSTPNFDISSILADAPTIAKTFGEYALMDYIIGGVTGTIAPAALASGKTAALGLVGKNVYDNKAMQTLMSATDINDLITKFDSFSPELKATLPAYQQHYMQSIKEINAIKKLPPEVIKADPLSEIRLATDLQGFSNTIENGTFQLRAKASPDQYARQIDSLPGLYQAMADHQGAILSNIEKSYDAQIKTVPKPLVDAPEVGFKSLQESYPSITTIKGMQDAADQLFDITKKEISSSPLTTYKNLPSISGRPIVYGDELPILEQVAKSNDYKLYRVDALPQKGQDFSYGTTAAQINPDGKYLFPAKSTAPVELYEQTKQFFTDMQQKGLIAPTSIDELSKADLLRKGFDSIDMGNGNIEILLANKIKRVTTLKQSVKEVESFQNFSNLAKDPTSKLPDFNATVKRTFSETFKPEQLTKSDTALMNALSAIAREPNQPVLKTLTESYLKNKTGATFNVKLTSSGNKYGFNLMFKDGNNIELRLPAATSSIEGKVNFVKSYFNQLKKVLDDTGVPNKIDTSVNIEHLMLNVEKGFNIPLGQKTKASWFRTAFKQVYGTEPIIEKGAVQVMAAGEKRVFTSVDDAISWFGKNSFSPEQLQTALRDEGFRVYRANSNWVVQSVGTSKTKVASGPSLSDIANQMGWEPTKLPASLAPREMYIFADDAIEVQVTDKAMYGTLQETQQFFNQFQDYTKIGAAKEAVITPTGRIYGFSNTRFTVQSDILAHEFSVASKTEAEELLRAIETQSVKDATLQSISRDKGIFIWRNGNEYHINDGTGNIKTFNNQQTLFDHIRENPTPTGAPDLFDTRTMQILDPIFSAKGITHDWVQKQSLLTIPESTFENTIDQLGGYAAISRIAVPRTNWLEDAFKTINLPEGAQIIERIKAGKDAAAAYSGPIQHQIDAVFKKVSKERQEGLYYYITGEIPEPGKSYLKKATPEELQKIITDYKLTPEDINTRIPAIKAILGNDPQSGLFALTGNDTSKFLTDYLPRLKDKGYRDGWDQFSDLTPEDILSTTNFASSMDAAQVKAFFKNSRTSELATISTSTNLYHVLTYYNKKTADMFFLNGPLEELNTLQKRIAESQTIRVGADGKPKGFAPGMLNTKLNEFKELITGMNSNGEEVISKGVHDLFFSITKNEKLSRAVAENFLPKIYEASYFTSMALKPSLVIRNTLQPLQTATPFLGLDAITHGYKTVLSKNCDDIFDEMRKAAVIADRAQYLDNFDTPVSSAYRKVVDFGMQGFKNSDDISRAVTWIAAKKKFSDGIERLGKMPKTAADWIPFFQYTNSNMLSQGFAQRQLKLLQSGDIKSAQLLYAREMVNTTMFRYANWNSPFGRTWIGKLFGQFGSYSASYIQMVKQTLGGFNPTKYAHLDPVTRKLFAPTMAQSLTAITSLAANSMALMSTFEFLRTRGDNFNPISPMYFNGGVMYKFAVNALGLASQVGGFNAPLFNQQLSQLTKDISPYQAKAYANSYKLKWGMYNYPNLYPGSAQVRSITKFADGIASGDFSGALLSLSGFSVLPADQFGRLNIPFLPSDDPLVNSVLPEHLKTTLDSSD